MTNNSLKRDWNMTKKDKILAVKMDGDFLNEFIVMFLQNIKYKNNMLLTLPMYENKTAPIGQEAKKKKKI